MMGILGSAMHGLANFLRNLDNDNRTPAAPAAPAGGGRGGEMLDYDEVLREHENTKRKINDQLSDQREEIRRIEMKLKQLFVEYDQASPTLKESYAVQIRDANRELQTRKKELKSYEKQLERENAVIEELRIIKINDQNKISRVELEKIICRKEILIEEDADSAEGVEDLQASRFAEHREPQRRSGQEEAGTQQEELNQIRTRIEPVPRRETETSAPAEADVPAEDLENIRKEAGIL